MSSSEQFYKNKQEQEERIRKLLKEAKPKIEYKKNMYRITKNGMLNDIVYWSLKLNSTDDDERTLALWMLFQYGEYMNSKPTNNYKIGSIGRFYIDFLSIKETKLKQELKNKKEELKNKKDDTLTEKEIEELLDELI